MDAIISNLVNLGIGGLMAAALIWFLYYLVTKTLPELMKSFREAVESERKIHDNAAIAERQMRTQEHQAILTVIAEMRRQQMEEHNKIMDRVDFGLREVGQEVQEVRSILDNKLEPRKWGGLSHEREKESG